MRALVADGSGPIENLKVVDVPEPFPGPGEVVVGVALAGLNFGDLHLIHGEGAGMAIEGPRVPGKEAVGLIVGTGSDVDAFEPGDRVLAQVASGALAEKVLAPAVHCLKLPDEIPNEDAVGLGMGYQTAWFALQDRGGFRPGDTVLVTGATGAVGRATVQLVKALEGTALGVVTSPSKADTVLAAGADHVLTVADGDEGQLLYDKVMAVTDGQGPTLCIDTLGGDMCEAALRTLAWRGRLVIVGFAAGRVPAVDLHELSVRNLSVCGLNWAEFRDRTPDLVARAQHEMFSLWELGRLKPQIMDTYTLGDGQKALAMIRDRGARGRILIRVDA